MKKILFSALTLCAFSSFAQTFPGSKGTYHSGGVVFTHSMGNMVIGSLCGGVIVSMQEIHHGPDAATLPDNATMWEYAVKEHVSGEVFQSIPTSERLEVGQDIRFNFADHSYNVLCQQE